MLATYDNEHYGALSKSPAKPQRRAESGQIADYSRLQSHPGLLVSRTALGSLLEKTLMWKESVWKGYP